MATVGHTLIGLSLGGVTRPGAREAFAAQIWLGLVVLLAHLVDVVEWLPVALGHPDLDRHFVTHSPTFTAVLVAAVCAVLALALRIRSPLAYAVAILAVVSHLLLDSSAARTTVVGLYGATGAEARPGKSDALLAELWFYGLPLVAIAVCQAWRFRAPGQKLRTALVLAGLGALATAGTRNPWLWGPGYGVALTLALAVLARGAHRRLLWNVVPVLPLLLLFGIEWYARSQFRHSGELLQQGACVEALEVLEGIRTLPTRSRNRWLDLRIGACHQQLGRPAEAEASFLRARDAWTGFDGPAFFLARLYSDVRFRDTGFYRPREAVRLLEGIDSDLYRRRAARMLEEWKERPSRD